MINLRSLFYQSYVFYLYKKQIVFLFHPGVKYDFFSIGEFWGCKSRYNDFGLQFRLFYYKQASLIGGVAVKAGRSIVTVMTIKARDSLAPPIVR